MSTVAQAMRKDLTKTAHNTSVERAAELMRDAQVGSLLVEQAGKGGQVIGIVTDTDIVRRAVAHGSDLSTITVQSIMTSPVATIESIRTIHDAQDMMADLGVRHLGVTEAGALVGLVSVRDLLTSFKRVPEPKIMQD
jgi:signal-transduction protein with cAMP-binding, CBS, and nucleotidyltransferase domain